MNERSRIFGVLALGFVLLGVSLTIQGVVWPSVAEQFDRPLSNLGWVTVAFGGGYTTSTLGSGRFAARPGIGPTLVASTGLAFLGLSASAAAPIFLVYLAAAFVLGLAGGLVDAGTNTYVAIERGAREMGIVHGSVGIGAIFGPLLVTALLESDISWRVAFVIVAAAQLAYAVPLWARARSLAVVPEQGVGSRALRRDVTAWSVAVFIAYAGMATGAGVWAFTYLTEQRAIGDGPAGVVVAAYFAAFTSSRFVLGWTGDRFPPDVVLRWSAVSTATALLLFWLAPSDWLAVAALVAAGFAHGPIFPLEMLLTPRRVGKAATARLVGFEIAGANVGGAALPGLIGLAVGVADLAVIPPLLFVLAIGMVIAVERLRIVSEAVRAG